MSSGQNDRSSTYLEQYVEGCYFVPTELSRVLNTIKALDERCCELSETLHETTAQLLSMPAAYQHPPGPEYFKLMNSVASDQKMLTQFSEEKVQLAQQAYDLIEMHALELERTMENFESDMRIGGMQIDTDLGMGSLEGLGDLYTPGGAAGFNSTRGQTPKLEDWNLPTPTDTFASLPLPMAPGLPPPGPATIQATSTAGPGAGNRRPGSVPLPTRNMSQKRPRTDEVSFPPPQPPQAPTPTAGQLAVPTPPLPPQAPGVQGPAAPAGSGPGYKKRAQSVGSVLNSMGSLPSDDGLGFAGGSALPIGALPTDPMFAQPPPPGAAPEGATLAIGFMTPPPAGLKNKSTRPQVPGRILGAADINPMLRGRHAELYWPDDASWYLIEIQDVEPATRKAHITYMTGEREELDLEEIVRDRHMSLIPPEFYGVQA